MEIVSYFCACTFLNERKQKKTCDSALWKENNLSVENSDLRNRLGRSKYTWTYRDQTQPVEETCQDLRILELPKFPPAVGVF